MVLHFLQVVLQFITSNTTYRYNYCPRLPPLENNHNDFGSPVLHAPVDHYNHHTNPQSHFVNASINHSSCHQAEQSLQQKSNKQPPKKGFIGRKSNIHKAEKAISRLFADSIASTDTSGNYNECTATANKITLQRQV